MAIGEWLEVRCSMPVRLLCRFLCQTQRECYIFPRSPTKWDRERDVNPENCVAKGKKNIIFLAGCSRVLVRSIRLCARPPFAVIRYLVRYYFSYSPGFHSFFAFENQEKYLAHKRHTEKHRSAELRTRGKESDAKSVAEKMAKDERPTRKSRTRPKMHRMHFSAIEFASDMFSFFSIFILFRCGDARSFCSVYKVPLRFFATCSDLTDWTFGHFVHFIFVRLYTARDGSLHCAPCNMSFRLLAK